MTMSTRVIRLCTTIASAKPLYVTMWVLLLPIELAIAATEDPTSIDDYRCGRLSSPGQYGPYDYRTATTQQKYLVEAGHFNLNTELLIKGTSTPRPGPDINYTLRVFPNHPRALKSAMELEEREKTKNPPDSTGYSMECWFNRALRFTPDDPEVRLVYGIFLLRQGKNNAAVEQLELARAGGLSSGNFNYNLGLAYFRAKEYEKARVQAYKAKELGFELEGLKNLLTKAGQWRDPPPKAPEQPDADEQKPDESSAEQTAAPKN